MVIISVAYLIILFSVQKYGTSKVGLVIGPALFLWFCSLGGIGIYNLVNHDSSVVKAFNPVHIYYYFKRNTYKAWYSLGGCVLCATGKCLCRFSTNISNLLQAPLMFRIDFTLLDHKASCDYHFFFNIVSFFFPWCNLGSEAMFADLCYFPVRTVQVSSNIVTRISFFHQSIF